MLTSVGFVRVDCWGVFGLTGVVVDDGLDKLDEADLLEDINEDETLKRLLLVLELEVDATVVFVHLMLCQVPLLSPYSYWEHGFMLVIFTLLT